MFARRRSRHFVFATPCSVTKYNARVTIDSTGMKPGAREHRRHATLVTPTIGFIVYVLSSCFGALSFSWIIIAQN
jgi:hypothetical protein